MPKNLVLENAQIGWKNFSGAEKQFNNAGNRNFCVFFGPDEYELAENLAKDGWNIKYAMSKDPDAPPAPYLQVAVSYAHFPPSIYIVNEGVKLLLPEDQIGSLDWADIESCDMVISPYSWNVRGTTGVKAYLKTLYANIVTDPFSQKYRDNNGAGV